MRGLIAAGLLASCATSGGKRPAEDGVPAVIVEPTPESRAALLQAVTDALGVEPLLADDALTRGSTLIIERRHLEGRERALPEKFHLLKIGDPRVTVPHPPRPPPPLAHPNATQPPPQ